MFHIITGKNPRIFTEHKEIMRETDTADCIKHVCTEGPRFNTIDTLLVQIIIWLRKKKKKDNYSRQFCRYNGCRTFHTYPEHLPKP